MFGEDMIWSELYYKLSQEQILNLILFVEKNINFLLIFKRKSDNIIPYLIFCQSKNIPYHLNLKTYF